MVVLVWFIRLKDDHAYKDFWHGKAVFSLHRNHSFQ
jgi:hypothetical protein